MTTIIQAREQIFTYVTGAVQNCLPDATYLPIKFPDVFFEPTKNQTWFNVVLQHTRGRQETFGDRRAYEKTGFFIIQINVPSGKGMSLAYDYAQLICMYLTTRPYVSDLILKNIRIQEEYTNSSNFSVLNVIADFVYSDFN